MIKVYLKEQRDKNALVLIVKGHAGMDVEGRDIVCAAASILAHTLTQIVLTMDTAGKLSEKPKVKLSKGDAEITCNPVEAFYMEAKHAFVFAGRGYTLLHQNFPDYLHCETIGIDE